MTTKKQNKHRRFAQDFSAEIGGSKTQQHFTDSVNVNNIVASFQATGIDPYAQRAEGQHFGYASSLDFGEAMRNIAEIESSFEALPSELRQQFQNDPSQWLDSLQTPTSDSSEIVASEASQDASEKPPQAPPEGTKNQGLSDENDNT